MTATAQSSLLSMLHGRASLRPGDVAMTFTDYSDRSSGVAETLTWAQLSRRTYNLAGELARHASVGDRAVILAPQSLDYVTAFLGAMQAGLIAVPLPLPQRGSSHERVSAVVDDTSPAVVLTTSAAAADVAEYVAGAAPVIVEVDALALDGDAEPPVALTDSPSVAYLQYSSGSTRLPAGAVLSHRNLTVNVEQLMRSFFANTKAPADMTIVSWLPFYHDMGLVLGICMPILGGHAAALTHPSAFVERPSRWIRALAENPHAFSGAPNFAFDLAARKTDESELAGIDLGAVTGIINGAERVEPATLRRFVDRFEHFNFRDDMIRPSYGLAEATVFVTSGTWNDASGEMRFDADELAAGRARPRIPGRKTTALVKYQVPQSPSLRIVDSETLRESAPGIVGEIWVSGDNVADGYWGKATDAQSCFGATLDDLQTPPGPWLRTGDLGFIYEDNLFIVGRIKDLLIIRGRNHAPEDIEATVQEFTGGRVAAIAVPVRGTEELVAVAEVKAPAEAVDGLGRIRSDVTAAVATAHGLTVGDLVLVSPGSIPTTTSGKVRRATCAELYRQGQFARVDAGKVVDGL
jgi:fatty acid CoA ligase FadD21